jgi:DNA-binding NtrC family response regulator
LTKPRIAVLDKDPSAWEDLRLMLQLKAEVEAFPNLEDFLRCRDVADYGCLLAESFVARNLQLRLLQAAITIPVIYLSAQPSISDAIAAIKLGGVDYLRKPVVPEELFSALDAALRQKRSGVPDRYFSVEIALDPMLDGMERELICTALQRSGGVVGGRNGAAAKLGVTRTGLLYKMKKLGLSRALLSSPEQESAEDSVAPETLSHSFLNPLNSSTTT